MKKLKTKARIIVILCLFLIKAAVNCGAENTSVAAVIAMNKGPYQKVWAGFKAYFKEKSMTLTASEYILQEKTPKEVSFGINKQQPGIIFTIGKEALRQVQDNVPDIPVVFSLIFSDEGVDRTRCAGSIVEISNAEKVKEIMRIVPEVSSVGIIYTQEWISRHNAIVDEIRATCAEINVKLIDKVITAASEFPVELDKMAGEMDVFLMLPDKKIIFPQSIKHIILRSIKEKFIVIGLSSSYTKAGALISFDCDYEHLGRKSAKMAERIMNGEKAADIGLESCGRLRFSLNMNVVKLLGIEIPKAIIDEAKEVFGQ